jgi:intracellular sulfur oxidation DsrE/DsrF family protein
MRSLLLLPLLGLCLIGLPLSAAEAPQWHSPAIAGHGEVVHLPDAAEQLDPNRQYKLIFDLTQAGRTNAAPLAGLEAAARFLNLAALAEVPRENLHLVMVIHGNATAHALADGKYNELNGQDNPSLPLIRQLVDYGVKVYVCGQALAGAGFAHAWVAEEVDVAVAALTVLVNYQLQGHALLQY